MSFLSPALLLPALLLAVAILHASAMLVLRSGVRRIARAPGSSHSTDPGLPRANAPVFVSVVVAARNEAEVIERTVRTLLDQDHPAAAYEIVVVDDRSTDGTAEILTRLAEEDVRVRPVHIKEIPAGWAGKMYALQRGVESSRGGMIVTTDADCIVPPGWISLLAAELDSENPLALVASPVDYHGAASWRWPRRLLRTEFVTLSLVSAASIGVGYPLVASGQSLGFTRALFDRIGGYARWARFRTGDDIFMLFESRRMGARVSYVLDPRATVITSPPGGPLGFYHQRARWASKGFRFPPGALLFSALVWFLNTILAAAAVAAVLGWGWLLPWLGAALAIKAAGEIAFLVEGRVLGLRGVVTDYLTGLAVHIPYVTVTGLAGTLQLFRWK